MTRQLSILLMALGLVLVVTMTTRAHHSFSAEYDANQPLTLRGTVIKMEWINPHGWLHIAVKEPNGRIVNWQAETGAPNALYRRGFTKNSIVAGTEVIVEGYRSKDGSLKINAGQVTLPDGRHLFVGSSGIGAPNEPK
jgi:hypothetical protein